MSLHPKLMADTPNNATPPQPPAATGPTPPGPAAKKILVVDDDHTVTKLAKEVLASHGFQVITAHNGKDAWFKLTPENMPHLIITDVLMPDMDGFAFIGQLKRNPETRAIPIMVMTSRKQMQDTFIAAGVDAFIAKPFTAEHLISEIKKILQRIGPINV